MNSLIAEAVAYEEDDIKEEALVSERRALQLRIASLVEFQPPAFQTKKITNLFYSLRRWRNWLGELGPGDPVDCRGCQRMLDEVERDLADEKLRGGKISEIRSKAEGLRTKLLATTQTPSIKSLLGSVDSVTDWVDQNEQAEIQEHQEKLVSLMAVSIEFIALNEAPNEAQNEVPPSCESTPSVGGPQSPEPGPQAQINPPRSFNELFPESGWDSKSKYTDADFKDIASYLRNTGHESWSEVPRIYTVLRLVDQVELVDTFLQRGMTDIYFPFSRNTLPKALKEPHRTQFLDTQEAVFSKALELERGAKLDDQRLHRKHAHFDHGEPLPFRVIGNLGSGAHGFVDKVVSTLSYKEFARKRFKRSQATVNQKEAKTFLNEVKILKTLRNRHCIDMVCLF